MPKKLEIPVGSVFGRLTVVKEIPGKPRHFEVSCNCGSEKFITRLDNLTRGISKSCGCYQKEAVRKANTTHGKSNENLYHVWEAIIQRCLNKNNSYYHHYGGRGIMVCDSWKSFEPFYEWALSYYKNGLEIERINNNGNYCPENCTFTDRKNQTYNKRGKKGKETKTGVI